MYPQQLPTFTCITRGSSFVEWRYNDNEDHVALTTNGASNTHDFLNATLVNITRTKTGETVLLSTLHLNSLTHDEITITCFNGDSKRSANITIYKNGDSAASYLVLMLVMFTIVTTA